MTKLPILPSSAGGEEKSGPPASSWFLLFLLSLIWGSSFILMKKGMETYTAPQVAALRMLIAGICLFPLVLRSLKSGFKGKLKYLLLAGALGNGIPAFLFTTAETGISSALAGMLNALTPLFTMLVGVSLFATKLKKNSIIGVSIGLAGAVLLINAKTGGAGHSNVLFALLVVLATVCYAFSVNIIRNKLFELNVLLISGWSLFFMAVPCGIFLFTTDFTQRLAERPQAFINLGYVALLASLGTALATVLYNRLVKDSSALFAASATYFIPFVAALWGLVYGEALTTLHFAGLGTILAGVWLANKK